MQKEFAWELSSMESTISRLGNINQAERDLLIALVRVYHQQRKTGEGFAEGSDGRVALEPTKRELAAALGVGEATIKRRLRTIKGTARYISVDKEKWRSHVYVIDFQAIYSAELVVPKQNTYSESVPVPRKNSRYRYRGSAREKILADDPPSQKSLGGSQGGSGGSNRGVRGIKQQGQGDHLRQPSKNHNNHLKPNKNQTIKTINDGSQNGLLNKFSFQDLQDREFKDAQAIQKRYEQVLQAGIANGSEADRRSFFALMIHCTHTKCASKAGLLTFLIRGNEDRNNKTWRSRANGEDDDKAHAMIKKLDFGEQETPVADLYEFGDADESEFTDEIPSPEEPDPVEEEKPLLAAADIKMLKEAQERLRKEVVQA